MKLILTIIVVLILLLFLYFYSSKETFDNTYDIKKFVIPEDEMEQTINCNDNVIFYPTSDGCSFEPEDINKKSYILDSTLVYLPDLVGFRFINQGNLKELHSKVFQGGNNLKYVDIMECGIKPSLQKRAFGINDTVIDTIGSNIFSDNLGLVNEDKDADVERRIAMSLFEANESGNIPEKNIDEKIKVVIYPETIIALSQHYNDLKKQTSRTNSASNPILETLDFDDLEDNEEIDMQIYDFIYNTEYDESDDNKPSNFKELLFYCLGVDKQLIDNGNFKIGKTEIEPDTSETREFKLFKPLFHLCDAEDESYEKGELNSDSDSGSGFEEYSDDDLENSFRIVYYKDVLFSTDLAYWRCNIFNRIRSEEQDDVGTTSSLSIPEYISKYCVFSDYKEDMIYLSFINIIEKIAEVKGQLLLLTNVNKYDRLSEEVLIIKNKNELSRLVAYYESFKNSFLEPEASSELLNLSYLMQSFSDTTICEPNDDNNCVHKVKKINQDGMIISPLDFIEQDYIEDIHPPYPSPQVTECSEGFIGAREHFFNRDPCPEQCTPFLLEFTTNGKTEKMHILIDENISVDKYFSMYGKTEYERLKLLYLNIKLFNPYEKVSSSKSFIKFAQLFHNIPTQYLRILTNS